MKGKRKVILGSALAIAMSASVIAGGTLALFTSESSVNIAVTSAKVQVEATLGTPEVYSPKAITAGGVVTDGTHNPETKLTAEVKGEKKNELAINNMAPGDKVTVPLTVVNNSTIDVKFRASVATDENATAEEMAFFEKLEVTNAGVELGNWEELSVGETAEGYSVVVELPATVNSTFGDGLMGTTANLFFKVEAIQGNAVTGTYKAVGTEAEFESAVMAARASEVETTIVLKNDLVLNQEIYLNGSKAPVVIDGNGHTLTASANFHRRQEGGQFNLLKVYDTVQKVTIKNIALKHRAIEAFYKTNGDLGTYHTLDIHTAGNVVLQDVTLVRDFTADNAGAALVLNASNVTVKGNLNLVAGGNAWGGVNVDNSTFVLANNANVSYLHVQDAYDTKPAFYTEHGGKVVNNSSVELIETQFPGMDAYQIAVAKIDDTPYADIHTAVAEAAGKTVTLLKDIELNKQLVLGNSAGSLVNNIVFDGNGHKITASDYFSGKMCHLVQIAGIWNKTTQTPCTGIVLQNVELEHRVLTASQNSYHTLNIWHADQVTLENVTIARDFVAEKEGAPLVITYSDSVTVKGELVIIAGGNAWYGVNVDDATLTFAEGATLDITFNENVLGEVPAIKPEGEGKVVNADKVGLEEKVFVYQGNTYTAYALKA